MSRGEARVMKVVATAAHCTASTLQSCATTPLPVPRLTSHPSSRKRITNKGTVHRKEVKNIRKNVIWRRRDSCGPEGSSGACAGERGEGSEGRSVVSWQGISHLPGLSVRRCCPALHRLPHDCCCCRLARRPSCCPHSCTPLTITSTTR